MSNLVMWNLIVGFLVPNLIAIVQQPKWSERSRAIATAALSLIFGGLTAFFTGQFNPGDIVGSVLIVGVAAITFYKGLWKPTGVAPALERATAADKTGERGYAAFSVSLLSIVVLAFAIVTATLAFAALSHPR